MEQRRLFAEQLQGVTTFVYRIRQNSPGIRAIHFTLSTQGFDAVSVTTRACHQDRTEYLLHIAETVKP